MSNVYPLCFSSPDQWRLWRDTARQTKIGRSEFCEDCRPDYKARMICENRCAHPGVAFGKDEDGMPAGMRPVPPKERQRGPRPSRAGQNLRPMDPNNPQSVAIHRARMRKVAMEGRREANGTEVQDL